MYQSEGRFLADEKASSSNSSLYMLATVGDTGDPMAALCFRL